MTIAERAFEHAVEIILRKEGVLSDDARDNGGLTKYGISQKAYPHLDIRALTVEDAIAIYRRDYWDKVRGDELPWQFALPVFDCAVNQGAATAVRLLQHALRVLVDGNFGPKTLAAALAANDRDEILARFMVARAMRYVSHEDWKTYGEGWMRRMFLITQTAKG